MVKVPMGGKKKNCRPGLQDGKNDRAAQSPGGGDHQYGEKERKTDGAGIGVQKPAERDQHGNQSTGTCVTNGFDLQELVHSSEL